MNLSIKWKLSISFVILSLILIGSYVSIASKTFENDKISYIFDSEQTQVENLSKQIEQKFDKIIFTSKSLLAGYDTNKGDLNEVAKKLFNSEKYILSLKIINRTTNEVFLNISKPIPNSLEIFLNNYKLTENSINGSVSTNISPLIEDFYFISRNEVNEQQQNIELQIICELPLLIPQSNSSIIVLSKNTTIINKINNHFIDVAQLIIDEASRDKAEKTILKKYLNENYLITSIPLSGFDNLRLTSFMPENKALGALKLLYHKSLLFIAFSVFAVIIISLLLSSRLTQSLLVLTESAEKISQGNFSQRIKSTSKDEVGVLSTTFNHMTDEIERLLNETKDKARMESELQTAKLVQESLFPKMPFKDFKNFNISGLFATSSECGGDWWYYFENHENLYIVIADATGHGTPAALITSAARSLFSQIENSSLTIEEMMTAWDKAVSDCSNKTMMMTGMIIQINKNTGLFKAVNASHELPYIFNQQKDLKIKSEPLFIPVGARLGEMKTKKWEVFEYELKRNDTIVIYTDGITAIENKAQQTLSEKKIVKQIEKLCEKNKNSKEICEDLFKYFENHRENTELPDDITLVVLEWKMNNLKTENMNLTQKKIG